MNTNRHTESVEVILKDQRRRRWSPAEKAALVKRTYEPRGSIGASIKKLVETNKLAVEANGFFKLV